MCNQIEAIMLNDIIKNVELKDIHYITNNRIGFNRNYNLCVDIFKSEELDNDYKYNVFGVQNPHSIIEYSFVTNMFYHKWQAICQANKDVRDKMYSLCKEYELKNAFLEKINLNDTTLSYTTFGFFRNNTLLLNDIDIINELMPIDLYDYTKANITYNKANRYIYVNYNGESIDNTSVKIRYSINISDIVLKEHLDSILDKHLSILLERTQQHEIESIIQLCLTGK